MSTAFDTVLASALDQLSLPGILIGHRRISPNDDRALLAEEAEAFSGAAAVVRRASGAARLVARQLLKQLGFPPSALPKAGSGEPIWPTGVVGSLAHDDQVAIAAVARSNAIVTLGVDVEPAEPLPHDLLAMVATAEEQLKIADDPFGGRLLFAAKEAVYKAVYPIDRVFLEHHQIVIDLANQRASTRTGRSVELRFCAAGHIVTVGFIRNSAAVVSSAAASIQ
jgi:4'-phosphopantetheinyl transferase EntD